MHEFDERPMITASPVPCGLSSLLGLSLSIQITVVRPERRFIPSDFSADRASMTTKASCNFRLIKAVLREREDDATLTCAKMTVGHRKACFVDGLDNLNLTRCLAVTHFFSCVAFAI